MVDLEAVAVWLERATSSVNAKGIAVSLRRGLSDRRPRSLSVDFRSAGGLGQLTIWESGAAEVVVGLLNGSSEPMVRDVSINDETMFVDAIDGIAQVIAEGQIR